MKHNNYKLYNDDCFNVINTMIQNSEYVDCIITDIPYNISQDNNFCTMKDRKNRNGIDFGDWDWNFDISKLSILPKVLSTNGSIVLFHSFEQYGDLLKIFENDMDIKDRIIWKKTNPMPRNRDRRYISNCEMGSWFVKKKSKWVFNRQDEKYQQMIFEYPVESGYSNKDRFHPTQKNLKLMEDLVKIHTNENDIIFDPFMGSGTTGVAALRHNRKFIGVEASTTYFQKTKTRIEDAGEIIDFNLW